MVCRVRIGNPAHTEIVEVCRIQLINGRKQAHTSKPNGQRLRRGGDSTNALSQWGRTGTAMAATRVRGGVFGEGEGKGCGGRIEASAATVSYGTAAAGVHAVVEECRRDLGLVGRD
jgi:hypothetical protein